MAITVLKGPEGIRTVLTAGGAITQLRSLVAQGASKVVIETISGYINRPMGISAESAVSGAMIRVTIAGLASGVICASAVLAGQSLQVESASGLISGAGHVAPLLSGSGAQIGKALMSGGVGSGIGMVVDFG